MGQRIFGSRFFLPKSQEANIYYPKEVVVLDEEGKPHVCAICLNNLSDDTNQVGLINRVVSNKGREFIQTPCSHTFHSKCLLGWFSLRFECPICRAALPIFEL
eukprot:TRINITY_DN22111_c0_g1_i2.p1 TRINITY_DN22111_c0_g1~~TRINITY_DN22111_c0_g1_i2.p1  ORF type:complete len:103 (+),score=19.79 TRINITY_DN22111_c0_g1_i2:194-502(+)